MKTLRRSDERGKTRVGWLDSRHSFSFGDYHDPGHVSFGPLRVINEDVIAGGGGFQPHSHSDMEIVTYVLSGALQHRDSLGSGSVIRAGEIQRMSAGTGIVHAEFNASREQLVHLLQIWILPSRRGIEPSYEQKAVDHEAIANKFSRIAAPDPLESEVRLMQDAEIWAARLDEGGDAIHSIAPGRRVWLQIATGTVEVEQYALGPGDALAVTDEDSVVLRATSPAEVLLFDLV